VHSMKAEDGNLSAEADPSVEFLLPADRAEVIQGKLYMMGGGWDRITVADFGQPVALGLAMAVIVPWHATDRQHSFAVAFQTLDGEVLSALEGHFTVGRPPLLEPGASQRAMVAVNGTVQLPTAGTYAAVVSVNGRESARITFRAIAGQSTAAAVPPRRA
jgi:hypothetical protein